MEDFTLNTETIRIATTAFRTSFITKDEFDRWLAEVKAQAWEEGFQDGHDSAMGVRNTDNPYRQGED